MLQRAASNAYSWWWASHIRTKQSKWLDNNLQEMDERVKSMLKIIDEDADSFARRAEMYFKRRPELLAFVEEAYKSYRALAERYDHISGELHKANHTIATAFPDQVQYAMIEEADENFLKAITPIDPKKVHKPTVEDLMNRIRGETRSSTKKIRLRSRALLCKEKAEEEINKLQKAILVLQTEKEFIKSSYESGIARYWEIEKKITDVQEEVYCLQDACSGGAGAVIEDDEARALMTATALKSCEDAVFSLLEQQNKSVEEERAEMERIKTARQKLKAFGCESGWCPIEITAVFVAVTEEGKSSGCSFNREKIDMQLLCAKVKEYLEKNPDASVEEIAEEIDDLVSRVTTLELAVSTQFAQINRLRSENDELEKYLQNLKDYKVVIGDSNQLRDKLKQAEEQLKRVETIEKNIRDKEIELQKSLYEIYNNFTDFSEKLQQVPPCKEDLQSVRETIDDEIFSSNELTECEDKVTEIFVTQEPGDCEAENPNKENEFSEEDASHAQICINTGRSDSQATQMEEEKMSADLYQLLFNSLEGREKILLAEYTSILRSYKETKKKLLEVEKKKEDRDKELMALVKNLKEANDTKDEEIKLLKQQLDSSMISSNGDVDAPSEAKERFYGHRRLVHMPWFPAFIEEDSNLPSSQETYDVDISSNPKVSTGRDDVLEIGNLRTEDLNLQQNDELKSSNSPVEEKFRQDMDELLEENLEFWLSFSETFHRIQELQTKFRYLQADIKKTKDPLQQEGSKNLSSDRLQQPESASIVAELRALKTELQVWLEQSTMLKGEMQRRFSALCRIQEEITGAAKGAERSLGSQLTPYQAAKFQGEVLNMKQENNKVESELQIGVDHVKRLQAEVEEELAKLHVHLQLSGSRSSQANNNPLKTLSRRTRVPLRSFLFGTKLPKRQSIFACMNPAFQRHYSDLRAGFQ